MNRKQSELCTKHQHLLECTWMLGWGCALQPLLVKLLVQMHAYPSDQMCRRGVRELKQAKLLKAKTWADGKTEVLILCKPAISFVTGKSSEQISSYPNHAGREPELLSIFRMLFAERFLQNRSFESFPAFQRALQKSLCTVCCRIGDLPEYWKSHFSPQKVHHFEQQSEVMTASQEMRQQKSFSKKKLAERFSLQASPPLTLEDLHRRGIFLIDRIQQDNFHLLHFGIFNVHGLSVQRILELTIQCHDWVRQCLNSQWDAQLGVFCMSQVQVQTLKNQLLKKKNGQACWKTVLKYETQSFPIVLTDTHLKECYLKSGSRMLP